MQLNCKWGFLGDEGSNSGAGNVKPLGNSPSSCEDLAHCFSHKTLGQAQSRGLVAKSPFWFNALCKKDKANPDIHIKKLLKKHKRVEVFTVAIEMVRRSWRLQRAKWKARIRGEGEVGSPGHAATSMHGYSCGMQPTEQGTVSFTHQQWQGSGSSPVGFTSNGPLPALPCGTGTHQDPVWRMEPSPEERPLQLVLYDPELLFLPFKPKLCKEKTASEPSFLFCDQIKEVQHQPTWIRRCEIGVFIFRPRRRLSPEKEQQSSIKEVHPSQGESLFLGIWQRKRRSR